MNLNSETSSQPSQSHAPRAPETGIRSRVLDKNYFSASGASNAGHIQNAPFNAPYSEQGKAQAEQKQLTGRKAKTMAALEKGVDPSELKMSDKKHFKGARRKVRNTRVVEEE